MQAVILVGGQATRLRPLTVNTPKAMIPVLNVPFLEHVIRHLEHHGVRDIVLAQHYLAGPIESHLGDGRRLGVTITYEVEETARGTAGAIKNVERHLTGPFLVLNGDIFTDLDFTAIASFHRQRRALVTIALTPVDDPTAYGLIETDERGRVTRFLEKPRPEEITTNMINAGTYVLEPEVLGRIPAGRAVSIERETFPAMLADGAPVYAYPGDGYWMDTGTPEKYLQLHRDLMAGRSRWYRPASPREVVLGEGCRVDATARIEGPAVIGPGCVIGAGARITGPVSIGGGCHIGRNSTVADSVIWQEVRLGEGVTVTGAIVADHCVIEDGATVPGCVVSDHVRVGRGFTCEVGLRIEPGATL